MRIQEGVSLEFSEMGFGEEDNVRLENGWAKLIKLENGTGFISKSIDIPGGDADQGEGDRWAFLGPGRSASPVGAFGLAGC